MSILPPAANAFSVTDAAVRVYGDDCVAVSFGGEYDPPQAVAITIAIPAAEADTRHHALVISLFMRTSLYTGAAESIHLSRGK
jgi:hypothetical protein